MQTNCAFELSSITDIIQAVVSVVNLLFVAGVFLYEKRQNRKDIIKEKKEYWYRETLLHRGIDVCENAFDDMEKIINRVSSLCENHAQNQDEDEMRKSCMFDNLQEKLDAMKLDADVEDAEVDVSDVDEDWEEKEARRHLKDLTKKVVVPEKQRKVKVIKPKYKKVGGEMYGQLR